MHTQAAGGSTSVAACQTPAVHSADGREPLPAPGQVWHQDFREPGSSRNTAQLSEPLRIMQWNIERGYKLAEIIAELKAARPHIVALQEVDVRCERSGSKNTGVEIAKALKMNYVFLCEFEELHSPVRSPELQGGGVHGNAILSRFDMTDFRTIEHRCQPVDWEAGQHKAARREPRRGRRAVLAVQVHCGGPAPLLCYCLHLEVFCGMLARMEQFADVLRDSKEQIKQGLHYQAILGDLNTMAHGIARLSPDYCCDAMRWRSLGWSEGAFWAAHLLARPDPRFPPPNSLPGGAQLSSAAADVDTLADALAEQSPLCQLGVSPAICADLLNPGFSDPFDAVADVTLDNPAYRLGPLSLMKGKLDWLLLRGLRVCATAMGNHDYAASDHKWLAAEVEFVP